ncbi:enoyl-CoA hydratase/isomerase family protein [Humitalea sp. 24SJ18S-53]|uniref:enoyl-CoA hydratase/isomerase family protein n=1 Tax=Humitalea sp. 24SJ18S-53 TaxID=3422307 RepID=UPI003D67D089
MSAEVLLVTRPDPRIAIVTINRPSKRNACDRVVWTGLGTTFRALAKDGVRGAVLTGAGGHFSAGDDILDATLARETPETTASYAAAIAGAFDAITEVPFPIVAAIPGFCIGGALSLALCCDFRVGTPAASLGIPAAKLGFVYPLVQCARLQALVGLSWARRILFTGDRIDGATAAEIGLLDTLTEGDSVAAALDVLAPMLDSAPLTIAATKRIFTALATAEPARHAPAIEALLARIEASDDLREGALAFAEKRRPRFQGQ